MINHEDTVTIPVPPVGSFANLEAIARNKALERIAKIIQRPDQLEKVEDYKKKEARKKASKEAKLKNLLQVQLEGVRTGLELLKSARKELQEVAVYTSEIQKELKCVPQLAAELDEVREESFRHSQYAMAMENMSNIFNISKNLEKANALITEGNLLHAHIRLSELESSRDELLFELYRVGNKSEHTMVSDYFSDVEILSTNLERQLTLNLKRAINAARKEPTTLVTTLRIIEREEHADAAALQRFEATGFLPPGRLKKLKDQAFEIFENSVKEQLEACQLESRAENKLWLVRYLEVIRQLILENLLVVKSLCVSCFPPSYNIIGRYVKMYHDCLSSQLQECIASGLEGNEFISLLGWVLNTYLGTEILNNPQLALDPETLPQELLEKKVIVKLMKDYLETIEGDYRTWRTNTLSKEVEEWWSSTPPQRDNDGHFHTEAPIIIFEMVDQNLQVAQSVSSELVQEMLLLSLDMIRAYGQSYTEDVRDFKDKYFEDRSKVRNFTEVLIAVVNNCLICTELAQQMRDRYWKSTVSENNAASRFNLLLEAFETLRYRASGFLLDEVHRDLEPDFQKLTRNWLKGVVEVETICETLKDYFKDYSHLKPSNFDSLMSQCKELVAKKYLLVLMSKKVALKNQEERKEASEKIVKEAHQMRNFFASAAKSGHSQIHGKSGCQFDAIEAIAEVVKVEDLDILSLELHSFMQYYPDVSKEQLAAILSLRGGIGHFDLKQKVSEIVDGDSLNHHTRQIHPTIFSKVQLPPSSIFN